MRKSFSLFKGIFLASIPTLALASSLTPCNTIAGNLVQNCGFETGDLTGWAQSGNTDSTFAIDDFDGFLANGGTDFVALGPSGNDGHLSQTFTTTPGAFYDIGWYLASDGGTPNDFNVTWDGNVIFSQNDLAVPDWVLYTFSEVATSSSTTLTLGFRNDLGYLALDDVSLTAERSPTNATPEPNDLLLSGTFILLMLCVTRRARTLRRPAQ